jgi:acetyltransferase-like isoleucine patch superfamily enzyme
VSKWRRSFQKRYRWVCRLLLALKIGHFKLLGTPNVLHGAAPVLHQPTLFVGQGHICLGNRVSFGVNPSPGLYSGYGHVEARHPGATIQIGEDTCINNGVCLISEGPGIQIGRRCLIGHNVLVVDSDFHPLTPEDRLTQPPAMAPVTIGDEVFIGSEVKIFKGVTIGDGAVIGGGSVVTRSVPPRAIAAGNPARVLRVLPSGVVDVDTAKT